MLDKNTDQIANGDLTLFNHRAYLNRRNFIGRNFVVREVITGVLS